MKTSAKLTTSLSLILMLICAGMTQAAPTADRSSELDYVFKANDLSRLALGCYVADIHRNAEILDRSNAELNGAHAMVYLSYHVLPGLSFYAAGGAAEYKTERKNFTSETKGEWALGVRANLLDHAIKDPTLLEDRIQLRSAVSCSFAEGQLDGEDASWIELNASLTLHLINEIVGNKELWPSTIGVYGGPVYSSYLGSDVSEDQSFGIAAGLESDLTESVSLGIGVEYFDSATFLASLEIRF